MPDTIDPIAFRKEFVEELGKTVNKVLVGDPLFMMAYAVGYGLLSLPDTPEAHAEILTEIFEETVRLSVASAKRKREAAAAAAAAEQEKA